MTDDTDNLVLSILEDIQARVSRMEERLNNLELQITAQEQYLATLVVSLAMIIVWAIVRGRT